MELCDDLAAMSFIDLIIYTKTLQYVVCRQPPTVGTARLPNFDIILTGRLKIMQYVRSQCSKTNGDGNEEEGDENIPHDNTWMGLRSKYRVQLNIGQFHKNESFKL